MILAGDIGGTKTLLGLFDPLPLVQAASRSQFSDPGVRRTDGHG